MIGLENLKIEKMKKIDENFKISIDFGRYE